MSASCTATLPRPAGRPSLHSPEVQLVQDRLILAAAGGVAAVLVLAAAAAVILAAAVAATYIFNLLFTAEARTAAAAAAGAMWFWLVVAVVADAVLITGAKNGATWQVIEGSMPYVSSSMLLAPHADSNEVVLLANTL